MCFPIVNSFDPNWSDHRGLGATGPGSRRSNRSHTVHFQNTGTAPAFDIVVLDTLDTDLPSDTLVASSHPTTFDILPGRVLRFTFQSTCPTAQTIETAMGFLVYNVSGGRPRRWHGRNTKHLLRPERPVMRNTTLNTIDVAAEREGTRPAMDAGAAESDNNKYRRGPKSRTSFVRRRFWW